MPGEVASRDLREFAAFGGADGFERSAEVRPGPCLHLDEHQHVAFTRDDVDLADGRDEVSLEDAVPLSLEKADGGFLAATTEFALFRFPGLSERTRRAPARQVCSASVPSGASGVSAASGVLTSSISSIFRAFSRRRSLTREALPLRSRR